MSFRDFRKEWTDILFPPLSSTFRHYSQRFFGVLIFLFGGPCCWLCNYPFHGPRFDLFLTLWLQQTMRASSTFPKSTSNPLQVWLLTIELPSRRRPGNDQSLPLGYANKDSISEHSNSTRQGYLLSIRSAVHSVQVSITMVLVYSSASNPTTYSLPCVTFTTLLLGGDVPWRFCGSKRIAHVLHRNFESYVCKVFACRTSEWCTFSVSVTLSLRVIHELLQILAIGIHWAGQFVSNGSSFSASPGFRIRLIIICWLSVSGFIRFLSTISHI